MTDAEIKVDLPTAWHHVATLPVGGLTAVGFGPGERYLLLVSSAGRGLIDTSAGEKVARDYQVPTSTRSGLMMSLQQSRELVR